MTRPADLRAIFNRAKSSDGSTSATQHAVSYQTSTSLSGDNIAMSYSGSFSLENSGVQHA
jgi:hypothetical protein